MKTLTLTLPQAIINKVDDLFLEETHLIFDSQTRIHLSEVKGWKQLRLKQVLLELLYDINMEEDGAIHSRRLKKHKITINKRLIGYRQLTDLCWRYGIISKNNKYSAGDKEKGFTPFTKNYLIKGDYKLGRWSQIQYKKTKLKKWSNRAATNSCPNQLVQIQKIKLAPPTDSELDFRLLDPHRWNRCQETRHQIEAGELLFVKREDRLYTTITQMPKELRQAILINNEEWVELDCRAASLTLLANELKLPTLLELALGTEDPYLKVANAAQMTREWAKEQFQVWINNGRPDSGFLFHLDSLAPGVLQAIKAWKVDNTEPWKRLFKIESDIILSFCEEHSLISVHDAILVPKSRVRELHFEFKKWTAKFGIELIVPLPKKVTQLF